jgi:hypothetical protein
VAQGAGEGVERLHVAGRGVEAPGRRPTPGPRAPRELDQPPPAALASGGPDGTARPEAGDLGEVQRDGLTEREAGRAEPWADQPGLLRPAHHALALGQHRAGVALDPPDRDPGCSGDLLDRLAVAQPGLDVARGHPGRSLPPRPAQLAPQGGGEPLVDGDAELPGRGRITGREHEVPAVLAQGDDVQIAHRASVRSRTCPAPDQSRGRAGRSQAAEPSGRCRRRRTRRAGARRVDGRGRQADRHEPQPGHEAAVGEDRQGALLALVDLDPAGRGAEQDRDHAVAAGEVAHGATVAVDEHRSLQAGSVPVQHRPGRR